MSSAATTRPDGRGPAAPAGSVAGGSPSGVLGRFTQALQRCEQPRDQLWLLLKAVREGVGADAVFARDHARPDLADVLGDRRAGAAWCGALAQRLIAAHGADGPGHVLAAPAVVAHPEGDLPVSAALVRLSRSREQWVGAVSFGAARPLGPDALDFMCLVRQLAGDHVRNARLYAELKETVLGLVRSFTTAIDAKDRYT